MVIKVDRDHIKAGKPKCSRKCPIALAMHDAGLKEAAIGPDCYWPKEESMMSRDLPPEAIAWIEAFDEGDKVKPFKFKIPDET